MRSKRGDGLENKENCEKGRRKLGFVALLLLSGFLNACAFDVVHVRYVPTQIHTSQMPRESFVLDKEVRISLGTGYSRKLKPNTKWDYVGTISEGDVFRTKDQILTIEASNIHEAYIVVAANRLVGFYLPVERAFSRLDGPQELFIKSRHAGGEK